MHAEINQKTLAGGVSLRVSGAPTFTGDCVSISRGAPRAEEPVGDILFQSDVSGLVDHLPGLFNAALPLRKDQTRSSWLLIT